MKKINILFILLFFCANLNAQIVINEYSCSNLSTYADSFGEYEDWIELYNTSNVSVDIAGYYISDKLSKPDKWQFPSVTGTVIPAHGFLIVYASNRDTAFTNNFHTSFALKQTSNPKEVIVLTNQSGQLVDSMTIVKTQPGNSYGRITDGALTRGVFKTPTTKSTNNSSTIYTYAATPDFSVNHGFYDNSVSVGITASGSNIAIRYTLDGKEPTTTSPIYSAPIQISSTTVLKAKTFSTNNLIVLPSFMEFGTYFIDVNHSLVVVSVSGENLTELVEGDQMLRPNGCTEYYDTNKVLITKASGEFNAHGKDSWVCDQRAIDFVARDENGINHSLIAKLFRTTERDEFQRIIFRASGDDNYPCGHNYSNEGSSHMRDGYIHNLAVKGDLNLDVRRSERMVLYVNGDYWGVYEIRENPDEQDFTKYYYDQDKYNLQYIETWGGTWAEYGGQRALNDWADLYDFIMQNDMSDHANFDYVTSKYNYKSLVDYILVNSFTVCSDWLNYNTGWWRGLDPNGDHKKWGYILWDNDATFGFYINYTGIPDTSAAALPCNPETLNNPYSDPEGHIKVLNKLNENEEFHQYYVARQADLLNTIFSKDSMLSYLEEYVAIIEPEMAEHAERWDGTYEEWQNNVERLQYFIDRRTTAIESGIADCYNLTGPYDLTLDVEVQNVANIKVNSFVVEQFPWTGKYYGDIETIIKIQPTDTSVVKFEQWSSQNHTFTPGAFEKTVTVSLTQADVIIANFSNVSVEENQESNFNVDVFPTAVTDFVTVDYYLDNPAEVDLTLYDLNGKFVSELIPTTTYNSAGRYMIKLDLTSSSLEPGMYILNFKGGTQTKSFKIVYLGN